MLFVKNIQLFNSFPVCVLWATHVRPLGRTHGDMRLKHGVLHSGHEAAGEPQTYKNKGRNEEKGQRKRQKTKTRTVIKIHGDVGLKHRVLFLRLWPSRWALNLRRKTQRQRKGQRVRKLKSWNNWNIKHVFPPLGVCMIFSFPERLQLHVHGHSPTDVGPTLAKRMCDLCGGSRWPCL